MFDWLFTAEGLAAFATLLAMEIVLGIDNIIFIAILAAKLPKHQQQKARMIGLSLAVIMRIGLLFALTWIMGLTKPLFFLVGQEISGRDLVLILGGLFLIVKATLEIHNQMEGHHDVRGGGGGVAQTTFGMVVGQIIVVDLVFSLDSIITAVGLTQNINIMIAAVIGSVAVMMVAAGPVADFVNTHPTTKMLALAFLVMIGAVLVASGFDVKVPKGYIYTAMAFSVAVEMLNVYMKGRTRRAALASPVTGAAALDDLLTRAHRSGALSVQLVADDQGMAHVWFANDGVLREDKDFPLVAWADVRKVLEARFAQPQTVTLDDVKKRVTALVSPPDARAAAVLMVG